MNLVGELRDATADICGRFAGRDADQVRDDGWREYEKLVKARARSRKGEQPLGLTRARDGFLASYPRGCIEYRRALGPDGTYGKWLRQRPIAVQVGRSVFMHAGAPPDTTESLDALNTRAREEIARMDRFVARLSAAGLAAPWFRLEDLLAVAAAEVRWVNGLAERARNRASRRISPAWIRAVKSRRHHRPRRVVAARRRRPALVGATRLPTTRRSMPRSPACSPAGRPTGWSWAIR
jgi:hypothetical protein